MGESCVTMPAPWLEFRNDKRLLWIAKEWDSYSEKLAEWAMKHLVNRRDVWSQYTISKGEVRVFMLPVAERRKAGTDMVTMDKLKRHFSGKQVGHLIGLHSISDHATCKWFAIDVDLHDESEINADEIARHNLSAVLEWCARIQADGLDPILMDSNGVGGYHIWTLLDKEYKLADVYDYADSIRADYDEMNLPRKPEIFPPRREVDKDSLPYGLRVPGRHPRRLLYNRIYNFDPLGEMQWLEGGEAIEAMLASRPGPLPKVAAKKPSPKPGLRDVAPKPVRKPKTKKTRVCVDLDGVLAEYHGWDGPDIIGQPLPGALKFAKSIAKTADIIVFTSRCSDDHFDSDGSRSSPGQMRIKVIDWLERHGFPFADVYIGQGKPRAAAFIDDRAITCKPQDDPESYANAEAALKALLKRKPAAAKVKEPKFNVRRGKVEK